LRKGDTGGLATAGEQQFSERSQIAARDCFLWLLAAEKGATPL